MRSEFILIGPMGVGKTTVAALLAQHLCCPQRSLDDVRFDYYREIGYDPELARRLHEQQGFEALYRYWKVFEIHALERFLADTSDCVLDLGAGHSVYEDDAYFRRARAALAPYAHVVLLLPSPDREESLRILDARTGYTAADGFNINRHILHQHSNEDLATMIVHTQGRTPEETCAEILRRARTQDRAPGAEPDLP